MEHLNLFDFLLIATIFVVVPIRSAREFPKFIKKIRKHGSEVRVNAYKETIGTWAVFALLLLLLWFVTGRSWGDLGFRWPTLQGLLLGSAIGLGFLIFIVFQLRTLKASGNGAEVMGQQLGDLAYFMPATQRDAFWFRWVSVNAGVTEELLFRGYLVWVLEPIVGLTIAAVMTVLVFTFAHAYQGVKQVPAIAVAAILTIVIFLVSDSLLVPIVFHVVLDLVQGVYLRDIFHSKAVKDEPLMDAPN